jgi:rhamnosyltransferase subunit B
MSAKIVIATLGSLGDLNPFIALAQGLRLQYDTVIATTEAFRSKVTENGIAFHPIRPIIRMDDEMMQRVLSRNGATFFVRNVLLENLGLTYEDLSQVAHDADLIIAGELVFAASLVAEKWGIKWVSGVLSPSSFASVYERYPALTRYCGDTAANLIGRFLTELGRVALRPWLDSINQLRHKLGLPSTQDAFSRNRFSPDLVLGLFPAVLGSYYPDWPPATVVTGAVFFDRDQHHLEVSCRLRRFLESGDPPLVFTLGSAAVCKPGSFYEESAGAARMLCKRAVLLAGKNLPLLESSRDIAVLGYEPYAEVFRDAAAVIAAAGAGTISQVLRAGCPMVALPYGQFDQPLNAARLQRLELARVIQPQEYTAERAAIEISHLLEDTRFKCNATAASQRIKSEDGLRNACQQIEQLIAVKHVTITANN